jgi:hypothetical protein
VKSGSNKNQTASVTLTVNDTKPKVPATAINYYEAAGQAAFTVLPTDNLKFGSMEGNFYNSLNALQKKGKEYVPNEDFSVDNGPDETTFISKSIGGAKTKSKKYTVYLRSEGLTHEGEVFPLTVNYVKGYPAVKLKVAAMDTFRQKAESEITVTGANPADISSIEPKGDLAANFKVEKRGNRFYAVANPSFTLKGNKLVTKGSFEIEFSGMAGKLEIKNVTIPIKPVAPKLALVPATLTVNTNFGSEATFAVTGGEIASVDKVKGNIEEIVNHTADTFTVKLAGSAKSNPLQLNVWLKGARNPILVKPTVKTTTAAATFKFSATTVTFGKDMESKQIQTLNVVPSAMNVPVDIKPEWIKVSGAAKDGVSVKPEGGRLSVTATAAASKTAGTMKYSVWPLGEPADSSAAEKKAHPQLTLNVKIDGKPLAATVKAEKDNIDLMDRANTKLSYIPSIKNTQADIVGVAFADPASVGYPAKLSVNWEAGKAVVRATNENIIKGESFKVKLLFTLSDGNKISTGTLTVKPAQSAVKHSIPKTTAMYQSRTMSRHIHLATFDLTAVTPTGARIAELGFKEESKANIAKLKYVNNPNNAYWFSFDAISQRLYVWLRDPKLAKPGRVTLTFSVTYEGQGIERFKPVNSATYIYDEPNPYEIKVPVTILK